MARTKYTLPASEVIVTVNHNSIECVTWYSGYRYRIRYIGTNKRDAVRDFRASFTHDYPNP